MKDITFKEGMTDEYERILLKIYDAMSTGKSGKTYALSKFFTGYGKKNACLQSKWEAFFFLEYIKVSLRNHPEIIEEFDAPLRKTRIFEISKLKQCIEDKGINRKTSPILFEEIVRLQGMYLAVGLLDFLEFCQGKNGRFISIYFEGKGKDHFKTRDFNEKRAIKGLDDEIKNLKKHVFSSSQLKENYEKHASSRTPNGSIAPTIRKFVSDSDFSTPIGIYTDSAVSIERLKVQLNEWMIKYFQGGSENIKNLKIDLTQRWSALNQEFWHTYKQIKNDEKINKDSKSEFAKLPFIGEHIFHMHVPPVFRLDYLHASLNIAKNIDDPIQFRLCHYIGNAYRDIGKYSQALDYYKQCEFGNIELCKEKSADSIYWESLSYAQTCASDVQTKLGHLSKSRSSIEACRKQFSKFSERSWERLEPALTYYEAMNLAHEGKYDQAVDYSNKAMDMSRNINADSLENVARTTLGRILILRKEFDKARIELEKSLQVARFHGDTRAIVESLHHLAKLYFDTNEKQLSYSAYKELAWHAQSYNDIIEQNNALDMIKIIE